MKATRSEACTKPSRRGTKSWVPAGGSPRSGIMFSMPLSTKRSTTAAISFARRRHAGQVGHGAHALFALDAA